MKIHVCVQSTHWQADCGKNSIGIFFDPPYSDTKRRASLYSLDSFSVAKEVNDFCVKQAYKWLTDAETKKSMALL